MEASRSEDLLSELTALRAENEQLRVRLSDTQDILDAIRAGSIDAVVMGEAHLAEVYTLQSADHPYRIFVETMQEGSITLGDDQTILYANQSFARMVRAPLERVIGARMDRYIDSNHSARYVAFRAQSDGTKCELNLQSQNGSQVPVFLSRHIADINGVEVTCLVVTDLTQQKRHEAILAAERLARSILEQAAEAIVVCDEHGIITQANRQAESLCGSGPLLRPFINVFPLVTAGTGENDGALTDLMIHPGQTLVGLEATLDRPGHPPVHLLLSSAPLINGEGGHVGAVVVLTDITGRREAEVERECLMGKLAQERSRLEELTETLEERVRRRTKQVEALSRSLTLAEQRERRRLSQVLHDDLQQILFGAELRLKLLHRTLLASSSGPEDPALNQCERIRKIIQDAVGTTRTLSVELNPPILDGEGLGAALDWLGSHMATHYGLQAKVHIEGDPSLGNDEQHQLVVQFIRELLFNIVKHAGVMECLVVARGNEDGLEVVVEDQGKGFELEESRKKHGAGRSLGLFSVEERLRLLGGSMKVTSERGHGTRILLNIPRAARAVGIDENGAHLPSRHQYSGTYE
jgi:PAS domain S-box-containing protein